MFNCYLIISQTTHVSVSLSLVSANQLFIVPPNFQDDLYCIVAILADQECLHAPSLHSSKQLARYPYLITNDRLLDHTSMLSNKSLFRRLYQAHAVHYRFVQHSSQEGCLDVHFSSAHIVQQRIQSNACLEAVDEDSNTCWAGKAWHFPVKEWPANERFVIRIPEKQTSK